MRPVAKRYDASNLPLSRDYVPDVAIPRKVYENFLPTSGPRALARALDPKERVIVERRADDLESALVPFVRPAEDDRVAEALSALFDSFTSMRQKGADVLARVEAAMRVLEPMPAWAVEEGCLRIRRYGYRVVDDHGRERVEQHWPPGDSEIFDEIQRTVRVRADALAAALALLVAPAPPPRVGRSVDDMLAEFKAQTVGGRIVDAAEAAELEIKHTARTREVTLEDRKLEYRLAGLRPPESGPGGVVTSLPMMLKMGCTIEDVGGQKVLVAPPTRREAAGQ